MTFNALSISLEKNNRKQLASTASAGKGAVSMLKMIETALLAGQSIREGKTQLRDYPAYVDVILAHEGTAIRLLEARYQMLGLVVLTQLTPIAKNKIEGFKYKIWGSRWDLDFGKLNQSQLRLASFRLAEANHAREILAELGVEEELNSSIKKIYGNAEMVNSLKDDGKPAAAAQREFVDNLNSFLNR
jgi:hypothetical protein